MSLRPPHFPFVVTETECHCYVCHTKGTGADFYHPTQDTSAAQPPAGWWTVCVVGLWEDDWPTFEFVCSPDCAAKIEWSNRGVK